MDRAGRSFGKGHRIASKEGGALVQLHPLGIEVQTAEQISEEYPGPPAAILRKSHPRPDMQVGETFIFPRQFSRAF